MDCRVATTSPESDAAPIPAVRSCPQPARAASAPTRETPKLNPQSQSLSRGYGSILPTSLIYIILSTRGCTPWRPEAVMSTTRIANKRSIGFSRVVESAPDGEKITPLCQPENLIAGQSDSKVYRAVNKKRELFPGLSPTSPVSLVLPLIIHFQVREY